MFRKFLCLFALTLSCVLFPVLSAEAKSFPRLSIMAVNFPCYDFARVLAGDTADMQMLLPPGSESHSYEPSPRDMIAIQEADLFVYTGGESDTWVEELLASLEGEGPAVFRLTDCVTLLAEEASDSMESRHTFEEAGEMDEHVWTSPRNVMLIAKRLAETLTLLSPENKALYSVALTDYLVQLEALDATFSQIVADGQRDLIVFGDRFPFRYFADAYGLRYDAAFPGCSEDSEPSVRTIISLVDTIRAEQIPVIFYIEFSSRRTANILEEETGAKPLLFHSCHNVSAEEIAAGASYLSLMWRNTDALKEALN